MAIRSSSASDLFLSFGHPGLFCWNVSMDFLDHRLVLTIFQGKIALVDSGYGKLNKPAIYTFSPSIGKWQMISPKGYREENLEKRML